MENVQGFKKVKSEFEQLLEEKLPGHHDSELLLHVSWRRLMQFNLTPSCPFLSAFRYQCAYLDLNASLGS